MRLMMLLPVLVLTACVEKDKVPSGAEDFATFCSACHGAGGKGDGGAEDDQDTDCDKEYLFGHDTSTYHRHGEGAMNGAPRKVREVTEESIRRLRRFAPISFQNNRRKSA